MIFLFYLLIPLCEFLPAAGNFSPTFLLFLLDRDIDISALNISLQLFYQCVRKNNLCIQIFHAGFLLDRIVKLQSQHFYFATILLHATVAIYWLCMENRFVSLFGVNTHTNHFFLYDTIT